MPALHTAFMPSLLTCETWCWDVDLPHPPRQGCNSSNTVAGASREGASDNEAFRERLVLLSWELEVQAIYCWMSWQGDWLGSQAPGEHGALSDCRLWSKDSPKTLTNLKNCMTASDAFTQTSLPLFFTGVQLAQWADALPVFSQHPFHFLPHESVLWWNPCTLNRILASTSHGNLCIECSGRAVLPWSHLPIHWQNKNYIVFYNTGSTSTVKGLSSKFKTCETKFLCS